MTEKPMMSEGGAPVESGSVQLFKLTNSQGVEVLVSNYGGIITSILVPDRKGNLADVVLGYDSPAAYMNAVDHPYFGAAIGRYGNRIAEGRFVLDGTEYVLATNNGPNHLHGGVDGFDRKVWQAESLGENALRLSYFSEAGEEGYPGNLDVTMVYSLSEDNGVGIEYQATTDKPTIVNMTNHSYFNLRGEGAGDVLGHELQICASAFTPTDANAIPTGELRAVQGTAFDFREPKPIGRDIDADCEQIRFGDGYDHNFVIDREEDGLVRAAKVVEPESGRVLECLTTEPAVQLYTASGLDGRLIGKSGKPYHYRGGFCLETQHSPDSPNKPDWPSCVLRPGEEYVSKTVYKFSVSN